MAKHPSRPQRWSAACTDASGAIGAVFNESAIGDLQEAIERLLELQAEYQDWRDNLPENLEQSPIAEKLDEISSLDFEDLLSQIEELASVVDTLQSTIDEAEATDLPRGFGRD